MFSLQIEVETSQRENAPHGMYKGSAAMDFANMYIFVSPCGSSEVYKYIMQQDKWIQLQNCPYSNSGLVIINNSLLSVGGSAFRLKTNKLFRLQRKKWKEYIPSMNTARSHPGLATQSHHLIVIGGRDENDKPIASVEVFDDQTKTWTLLSNLPHPLNRPSATLCGEQLYVLSGDYKSEGYCCSIKELSTSSGSPPALTWTPIPRPPVYLSTIATLSGVPVVVGGSVRERDTTSSTVYSLSHGQWMECGHLYEARFDCLVASHSTSHMLVVVGGFDSNLRKSATVELCSVG